MAKPYRKLHFSNDYARLCSLNVSTHDDNWLGCSYIYIYIYIYITYSYTVLVYAVFETPFYILVIQIKYMIVKLNHSSYMENEQLIKKRNI